MDMAHFIRKNKAIIAVGAILLLGIFLRAYHFGDWLHFELDQSRDANVVGLAVEQGIGNLPLLGPKAAGSFLRLGPLFYYYEYLSALIFGNDPVGIAMISLLLSCASMGVFYLFVRRYFERRISAALLLLYATSLFLVMYSRFAWNPNNLPFFILLLLYAVLRSVDTSEKRRGWWLLVASVAISFVSHLHFVAFMALPVIVGAFYLIKRPKIAVKYWIAAVALIIFFYLPPIINDLKTGGESVSEFKKVFLKKSTDKNGQHTLVEKIYKGTTETALGYFIIETGFQKAEIPTLRQTGLIRFDALCDKRCRSNLPWGALAMVGYIVGFALLVKNTLTFQKGPKGDFVILVGLWFAITSIVFVPISYDFAPRFFLLIAPIPFVFLGFLFDFFAEKKMIPVMYGVVCVLVLANLFALTSRFSELSRASQEYFNIESDKILKERDRVTLQQQLEITDYIQKIYKQNNFPVYVNSEAFYRRSFLYHLEHRGIVRDDFRNTGKNIYAHGNYFLIYIASVSPEENAKNYLDKYDIVETRHFGTLDVIRLAPKPELINADQQVFGPSKKPTSAPGVPVRCRWNEIFGKCNQDGTEDAEDGQEL